MPSVIPPLIVICLALVLIAAALVANTAVSNYYRTRRDQENHRHEERLKRMDNTHEHAMLVTTLDNRETIEQIAETRPDESPLPVTVED